MAEAIAHLNQAIQGLRVEVRALRKRGIREGSIESYSKGVRTYYNYVRYQEGKPIRKYLPLGEKPSVEAEIGRGRKLRRLETAISLLQEASRLLEQK